MIFSGKLKAVKAFFIAIFSLTCFILAMYMAFQQFKEYFSNQDFTIISRRAFLGEKDDVYPAVSVCLFGAKRGRVFKRPLDNRIKGHSATPLCRKRNRNSNKTEMVACRPYDYFLAMSGKIDRS